MASENSRAGKGEVATTFDEGVDHGRNAEGHRSSKQVGQVSPSAGSGFLVLMVSDQRPGGEREDLVEKIEGQQVAGEGNAESGGERQGEEGKEARLGMLL